MSSQDKSPSGTRYGVSIRLLPCTVAVPVRRVSGVMMVDMSENPTSQVGSVSRSRPQSSRGSRSIAVSPPQGGTTAPMPGSVSIAINSPARSAAGALR